MDYRTYISVFTPPVTSGNLTVQIQTFNAVVNFNVSTTVAVLNTDDEITTATNIQAAILTLLQANSFNFIDQNGVSTVGTMLYPPPPNGAPVFSNFPPLPQFRPTRSDFVICMWSQCQYRIQVSAGSTGTLLKVAPTGLYCTLAEFTAREGLQGADFTDINGVAVSNTQLMTLCQMASDQISKICNNKIIYSTYFHAETGRGTASIVFRVRPGIEFDLPQCRRPYIISASSVLITKSPVAYDFNTQLGILTYRFSNGLIEISEPFGKLNEIKTTYTAGYLFIPDVIKDITIQIANQLMDDPLLESYKGSDFTYNQVSFMDRFKYYQAFLREFVL